MGVKKYEIIYRLEVAGSEEVIHLRFDERFFLIPGEGNTGDHPWIRLESHRCRNCPLSSATSPDCPAARNLIPLVEACAEFTSHDEVRLEVCTPERRIVANTTMQRAVSSLLGLVMATSGCPHMAFFRPMARFHLPLASEEETIFRSAGTYLLSRYFLARSGATSEGGLEGLREIYANLQLVNRAMAERLRSRCSQDAAVNALVILDLFAKNIPYSIEDALEDIAYLFE